MGSTAQDTRIGGGFNLVMALEDPARLAELMQWLGDPPNRARIDAALESLDYVHYARFLPIWEHGLLLIVTEYDGNVRDYVMDFAATLDLEFSKILSYMKGRPRLPVGRHPAEFWAYVQRNTRPQAPYLPAPADPYTPYADKTVLDILPADRAKKRPPAPALPADPLALHDVQANVLRGFRATRALHLGLRFGDAAQGCAWLAAIAPRVTAAA